MKMHKRRLRFPAAAPHANRPAVARPTPVGRVNDEFHARDIGVGQGQGPARRRFFRLAIHEQPDDFPRPILRIISP